MTVVGDPPQPRARGGWYWPRALAVGLPGLGLGWTPVSVVLMFADLDPQSLSCWFQTALGVAGAVLGAVLWFEPTHPSDAVAVAEGRWGRVFANVAGKFLPLWGISIAVWGLALPYILIVIRFFWELMMGLSIPK